MTAIAASNVTYTIIKQSIDNMSNKRVVASLQFGNGTLTYPTGGVPIVIGNLGLPNYVSSLKVFDSGTSGYSFQWDSVNSKLRLYGGAAHNHSLFLKNAAVADGATTRINANASNLLGAGTGSNITVVGSDGSTTGGVVTASPGTNAAEITTAAAPASLTIVVEAIGY